MRDDIWYREDLEALLAVTEDAIRRADPRNFEHMVALGHLHIKLSKHLETAPSARTPEAAA